MIADREGQRLLQQSGNEQGGAVVATRRCSKGSKERQRQTTRLEAAVAARAEGIAVTSGETLVMGAVVGGNSSSRAEGEVEEEQRMVPLIAIAKRWSREAATVAGEAVVRAGSDSSDGLRGGDGEDNSGAGGWQRQQVVGRRRRRRLTIVTVADESFSCDYDNWSRGLVAVRGWSSDRGGTTRTDGVGLPTTVNQWLCTSGVER
ncbi:hypothetical protein B296_00040623 [Ensete ventricosum]|uniref:Uncharacterized protein n=1 Tax=Ensete ventricosum TaxID=4639 RepID=A0A426X871_ENSVE|nr:hypothetical protein B296_00040623 [Ensete ventricosum]